MIEPLRGSLRDRALISSADLATLVSCSARAFNLPLRSRTPLLSSCYSCFSSFSSRLSLSHSRSFVLADWFSRFVFSLRIVVALRSLRSLCSLHDVLLVSLALLL